MCYLISSLICCCCNPHDGIFFCTILNGKGCTIGSFISVVCSCRCYRFCVLCNNYCLFVVIFVCFCFSIVFIKHMDNGNFIFIWFRIIRLCLCTICFVSRCSILAAVSTRCSLLTTCTLTTSTISRTRILTTACSLTTSSFRTAFTRCCRFR